MEIYLEGTPLDVITTAAGEVLELQYSGIAVGDGQLTVEIVDHGGVDPNALINGLVVLWSGEDTTGPRVLAAEASGTLPRTLDQLTLTFSEHLLADSFTLADIVAFAGPDGPISATSVAAISEGTYQVDFSPQTAVGEYQLTLAAAIADKQGNLIDQDQDGIGGESPDDEYTAIFELEPLTLRYDFGLLTSPLAPGYTQVTPASTYNATAGFGWQGSGGAAIDRNAPDPLTSDLVYASQLVFEADVPDGVYSVRLDVGDAGPHVHDQMRVLLEGIERGVLTSAPGEVLDRSFDGVTVSDGRLTLELIDGGGQDVNVVLNGAEFRLLGPDTFGPQVTAAGPSGDVSDAVDHITLTFNEPIDEATLNPADVIVTGPSGPIAITSIARIGEADYEVSFAEQAELGDYQVVVGPDIFDPAGNAMDQDADGIAGESGDDQLAFGFTLVPSPARYDFGPAFSPVGAGYTRVAHDSQYTAANGFGYTAGSVIPVDRGVGTDVTRDLHYASSFTFAVDGSNGLYDIELTVGDTGPYGHDAMAVYLEGVQVDVIDAAPGTTVTANYSAITVSDGQVTLRMVDLGGSDANVVINAVSITRVGEDSSPPRVIAATPSGPSAGTVDRITLDFSKPIDAATFTSADVIDLSGPGGAIPVTAIAMVAPSSFEIQFASQSQPGQYAVTVGPDIADLGGVLLDQDQDGIAGEEPDDRYSGNFSIEPFALRFDFGASFSPVAAGYTQVTPATWYTSQLGHGWQSGGVQAIDRGGDPLSGDLVYGAQMTFAADVPSSAYEVTLLLGDLAPYPHDAIEVWLEGVRIDTVSSPPGEVLSLSYSGTPVVDGQLNVQLVNIGGVDPNAVLNGLEIRAESQPPATRVLSATSQTTTFGALESVRVVFNRPIDAATFTTVDASLSGPAGPVSIAGVTAVSSNEFDLTFATQGTEGTYTLTVGPAIQATTGDPLDQDGDGQPGEIPDDQYTTTFDVGAFAARFDFAAPGSPTAAGYVPVLPWEAYAAGSGYGYLAGGVAGVDRFFGTDLERDIHYGNDITFAVDVPDGLYDITVHLGDRGPYAHDLMGVFIEGVQVDSVSTNPGEVRSLSYSGLAVQGGRLELRLADLGGSDVNVVAAGLEITAQTQAAGMVAAYDAALASWRGKSKPGSKPGFFR